MERERGKRFMEREGSGREDYRRGGYITEERFGGGDFMEGESMAWLEYRRVAARLSYTKI